MSTGCSHFCPLWLPVHGLIPSCAHLGLSHLTLASLLVHRDLKHRVRFSALTGALTPNLMHGAALVLVAPLPEQRYPNLLKPQLESYGAHHLA